MRVHRFLYPGILMASFLTIFLTGAQTPVAGNSANGDLAVLQSIIDRMGTANHRPVVNKIMENGRIVFLDLTNRDLTKTGISTLPPAIGDLTELRTLILNNNNLSELPVELGLLKNLRRLDVGSNQLSTFPMVITRLSSLDSLDLRFNDIEILPQEIANLHNLSYLQVWGNRIASIPRTICSMKSLREFYVSYNRLSTVPLCMTELRTLSYVDLQENKFCSVSPQIDRWLEAHDQGYRQKQWCEFPRKQ